MTVQQTPPNETDLATQLRTRGLLRTIADDEPQRLEDDRSEWLATLSSILNATDAPPIDLHVEEALSELEGPRFFFIQHVVCELIPLLDVDKATLLAFVARLVDAGGNDLAAGDPSAAFGEWTTKDPARSREVYDAARTGDNLAIRQLFNVLRINADVGESLVFAQTDQQEAKLAAISALGAIELGERYEEVLTTLLHEASIDDEDTALRCLEAGYSAAARREVCVPVNFDQQLERLLETRSPRAIHLAANLLWRNRDSLTERAINSCLEAVANVDPNNIGTISQIDHAAYALVSLGHAEQVVRLISRIIDCSEGQITLDAFQSTYHKLAGADDDVFGGAIVYWLFNGTAHTRQCVANQICSVGRDRSPFAISKSCLPPDSSDQLFVCRKAVGWFFIDPLAAVAIPIAVLRHGCPDIANDVLDLIYDPLLLSYDGQLKKCLERYIADGHANSSALAELLARKTALQDAMEGIESLVELHPTETQRETARIHWDEQLKRGMEKGRRGSILEDLFTKQYLLYGRSSLAPVHTGEGTTDLTEIEMHSFSISSELPMLNTIDTVGLDHTLLHLKFESRD